MSYVASCRVLILSRVRQGKTAGWLAGLEITMLEYMHDVHARPHSTVAGRRPCLASQAEGRADCSFTVILYSRMVGLVGRVEPGCAPAIDMKCPGWVDKPFFSSASLHSHDSLQVSA